MAAEQPTGEPLRLEMEDGGVAALIFDRPGSRVNLLTHAVLTRLDALLEEVERGAAEGAVRVLVVRSAKAGSFIAGADLAEMREETDPGVAAETARRGQGVLRRLEALPVPTFAAIHGACLGAGAELALACGYRMASDAPETRIGFPEVQLGIIPGLGGTVRLPRLVGVRTALELILSGRRIDAREAHRLGVVDAVYPPEELLEGVLRFARGRAEGARVLGGSRRGVARRLLEDTAPGRRLLFARLAREIARGPAGGQAAPRRALQAVADGVALPLERAFEREAQAVGELIVTREAKGLLHAFRLRQAARRQTPSADVPAARVEQAVVLGAGRTGAEAAYLLAVHGIPVRLRDVRSAALEEAMGRLRTLFGAAGARGLLPAAEVQARAELVSGTRGFGGFGTADLVVEAVDPDPEARRAALGEVEEHVREDCILVATGAAVPLGELAGALRDPARLVGLHFIRPAAEVPLVEVVRGEHTSPRALATAVALARRLGKVPLVVADSPGLLVDRAVTAYLLEALRLVEEGAAPEAVDGVMEEFGMAAPPLRLLRELGPASVARTAYLLEARLGERFRPPALLERWPRVEGTGDERRGVPPGEAQSRMVLALVNEAARALEEGVVGSAEEVDLAMSLGAGFPAYRGGLLFHADRTGLPEVVRALEEHAARLGDRFAPAPLLLLLAEEGGELYGVRRAGASGQDPAQVLR